MNNNFHEIIESALSLPTERTSDVVRRRFGVDLARPQTLQAIGNRYDITRERVRQIVRAGMMQIHDEASPEYHNVQRALTQFVKTHGGIMHVERLYEKFSRMHSISQAELHFLIAASQEVSLIEKHKAHPIHNAVHLMDFDFIQWGKLHDRVHQHLKDQDYVCTHDEVFALLTAEFKKLDSAHATEHLHVSQNVKQNPFGKWGLTHWNDVTPKSIRDKVYLVLENEGTPLHFRDIATRIDDHNLGKGTRKTHPQTVHNELIKDQRFVLSGRGTYDLANEQYIPGSVRDVIISILGDAEGGLTMEDLIDNVLAHRNVKPSTIKINVHSVAQNNDGRYSLK